ncbi:MAG: polysaccharide biosynthesis/export family protein [Alphaproteobacteria bacterium]|nr:sugar ABC transporter substrate-binding protein [Rhizobiaceae bacterium]MBU3962419.1 polysaccharide biosynthesis/export family protein [Alphaproteobacteria bacterium]MBU4048453.1 polysaccharide biosynthesis/export family protein [Alphaproteobacteria bacterium]MBU4088507.1 polysaccharide biosynthesis/export family protein [Alphaproteobacteria bacterium]MBU4159110.1 polysaccharide biosynthesis/export family protein [Alphaproteobacteria bacterium]
MSNIASIGAQPRSRFVFHFASAVLGLLLLAVPLASARADDYRLDVMDKLRIRVAEWRTAEGAVRDWSTVSGDYTVGAAGTVSLPFLGELIASGKTTAEVAEEVGTKMQLLFGLRDRPSASVELAQYRPIYLAGEVQTPGEYPYAPNMTVLKAISLGGGLRRGETGQRFARDFIRAEGDSSVLVAERNRLLVRRARLQAEIAGSAAIAMPGEIKDMPEAADLLASETALMQTRDKRLKLQLTALADLKTLLRSEIESLAKKSETQSRQLKLVESDREKVYNLTEKGLTVSSRRLAIEQQVADLQAGLLDIDTATLKAKQDVSKATQDETDLKNDRDAQLAQELQNTERELDTIALKLGTSRDLMAEAMMQSAEAATVAKQAVASVSYSIVREKDGKASEIPADENTRILPGDVVKVAAGLAMR